MRFLNCLKKIFTITVHAAPDAQVNLKKYIKSFEKFESLMPSP
jgi:hypothetical protein